MTNANELHLVYKLRRALNENLENLPSSTTDRLAAARRAALSRQTKHKPLYAFVAESHLATQLGAFFQDPQAWAARIGVAALVFMLAIGLSNIIDSEQQQRIKETADLDALVLTDELPLSAYLDHGFNAYLDKKDF